MGIECDSLSLLSILDYVILLVVGTYHMIPLLSTTTYTPLEKNSGVLTTEKPKPKPN